MVKDMRTRRERWEAFWGRRSRVGKITLVLLAVVCLCTLFLMFHVLPTTDTVLITFASMAMTPLLLILLFRWFTYRVLWRVRNRLILTYLLMGLAPLVMFVMLMGIASYLMAGQYATNVGLSRLTEGATRVRDAAGSAAVYGRPTWTVKIGPQTSTAKVPGKPDELVVKGGAAELDGDVGDASPLSLMEQKGSGWVPLEGAAANESSGALTSGPVPGWLHSGFQGIVEHDSKLYFCAEVAAPRNGRQVSVLGSRELTREEMDVLAKGLGRIELSQSFSHLASDADTDTPDTPDHDNDPDKDSDSDKGPGKDSKPVHVNLVVPKDSDRGNFFDKVSSSPMVAPAHAWRNPPVWFTSELPLTSWETGDKEQAMIAVISRPTYLYALLFASSVKVGKIVWAMLIGIAGFFALMELFALAMATSLSLTITRSVAELYKGTRALDAGHLEHRIPVKRKDQLAALANSFNGMAASVSALLVQQREKERLLNELAIAQEVQTTLFPQSPAFMGSLEVHGTCLPARTVGGDYFDFIFGFGPGLGADGKSAGHVTLALGDISGKGISAALLMSALHSADRAFSAAVNEEGAPVSPALLLKLLNAHLYRSTQSARYATLFLATYDPATRRLTYSNGGHLPPLVISKDGSVQRLEVGGAVVGLLDGLEYEEATVQLEPGDLFVAYTDGLTEPEKNGEDFGEERLMEFVRARRDEPLTVLATHTLQVVKAWIGDQEQPDDMTVVLARQG
jgi:sigma-B regulation protein RsbU (phosphoserine phosphatase)